MENARTRATSSYIGRICAAVGCKTRAPAKRRIYGTGRPPNHYWIGSQVDLTSNPSSICVGRLVKDLRVP
jgi:hypothetical protein